jgi:glucosamine--fructose-6-phosphate aminotransferase (isomerizing)
MCGIFGCVTVEGEVAPIIHSALKRLEYRGYDSAGEATVFNEMLHIKKDAGKIDEIHARLNLNDLPGRIGIGHTRWATHGAPVQVNAHPHTDCKEEVAVVHNGIIENFVELRKELETRGHVFKSRTDTEVIPHLIEENLKRNLPFPEAVRMALKKLKGSYAIAAVHARESDRIICARKESPLVIGFASGSTYCASDIPAFLPLTNKVIFLEEGEMAILTPGTVKIFDIDTGNTRHREIVTISWTPEMAEKAGFPHFMLKEIHEQPKALRNALRTQELYYNLMASTINVARHLFLVACGSAYHACLAASYIFSNLAQIDFQPVVASEFIERFGQVIDDATVVLAVTQSGETADTLNAVRYAREKGATILGITNVMGSTITQLAGIYVGQNSGPEIGVAATKTFTAQLMVLTKLAINLAEKRGTITQAKAQYLRRKLWAVPEVIRKVISNEEVKIKELAWKYRDRASFCFLGRGINFATALEGRLKLLEIAYVPSLAYPAGESKHGFIALVEEGYPVIFVAPNDETHSKIIGNIMEMKARGARIIAIIEMGDEKIKGLADDFIEIPSGIPDIMTPIVYVIPLQLFAYYSASARGYNPDTPRNLAKSVTVE